MGPLLSTICQLILLLFVFAQSQLQTLQAEMRRTRFLVVSEMVIYLTIKAAFLWDDLVQDHWSEMTWIILHQRNQWILSEQGFNGSFDAPWSKWSQITYPKLDHSKGTHPKILWYSRKYPKLFFNPLPSVTILAMKVMVSRSVVKTLKVNLWLAFYVFWCPECIVTWVDRHLRAPNVALYLKLL